jgi:ribose 5-phosphate isomerase A
LTPDTTSLKRQAAAQALQLVKPGMTLGLGTGSTANAFVELLGERVRAGSLDVRCVATSKTTQQVAQRAGLALDDFRDIQSLDLTVDGADEIDPQLNLIKGGGGALLHEKIVAMASEEVCIVADHTKQVSRLGRFPLPIEVIEFGLAATMQMITAASEDAGCRAVPQLRCDSFGTPFVTDSGHLIVDCSFGTIPNAETLADVLDIIPGVVDHGLFIDLADRVIIAGPDGVTILEAEDYD